jgi:predicted metal-dependent phosphoesterase TrpH
MAYVKGLDIISVCDHNSCLNLPAAVALSRDLPIKVLPGMELETAEEVHCLCYFKNLDTAMDFGDFVAKNIPITPINKKIYGSQDIYGERDEKTGEIGWLLSRATNISIGDAEKKVHKMGGLFIPAHFDKSSYSVSSNLGFLPPNVKVDGIEVFKSENLSKIYELNGFLKPPVGVPVFYNSDAHSLGQINERVNYFERFIFG